MRLRQLHELTLVRFKLFVREPEAVFWAICFPLILSVVLGFAFAREEVEDSRVLVLESVGAEELAARLTAVEGLVVERGRDPEEARRRLRKAAVDALLRAGDPVDLRFDPRRPEGALARLRVEAALRGGAAVTRPEAEDETGFRYIDFLFPGLLGMGLMGTGVWAIGFAVVDLRRKKLLKRFLVTPMSRASFLMSFMSSRIVFLGLEFAVLLPFGLLLLKVPFAGSILAFAITIILGTLAFASIGLLIAARPKTVEGASGIMNVVMMPMWLGSGLFFSYERFPAFLQPFLKALPLTAVNDALRAIMLDGAGCATIWPEALLLVGWALVSFWLALKLFRWQ
ncbi:MAG: ABC transporter permease [Planctomycetes bacterium]|nr:ABC transporter permease [Planctomycetota bacterium]